MDGQFNGQISVPVGGATQVIYARKSGRTLYNNYSEFQAKFSGAAQITFGILLVLLNILLLMTEHFDFNFIGHGIWGGIILITSGSVGIASSTRKTKCLAISYMILSIISALLCIPLLAFSIIATMIWSQCKYWRDCPQEVHYGQEFATGFNSLMIVFTVLGGISAIWGSTLCCKAAACCSDDNEELVPMQIVTADSNQKTLPGNSNRYPANDNLSRSAVDGYEKLKKDDEVYDTIEEDLMDSVGYERYMKPSEKKYTNDTYQGNYEKCYQVIEDQAENRGVAGYDKLTNSGQNKNDYIHYEEPVNYNDYLDVENSDTENKS